MATTTTTRKATATRTAPAVPTIARLADGRVMLTDLPFMIPGASTVTAGAPGRANLIMGSRGLGWAHEQIDGVKGWVNGQPGAGAAAAVRLAEFGVAVVDLSGKAARKPAATRKPTAPATTRKATAPELASIMTNAETVAHSAASALAATITAALASEGMDAEIIAAAIAGATAAADKIAKAATATASEPAPVRKAPRKSATAAPVTTRKATPRKAAAPATAVPAELVGMTGAELAALGTDAASAEIERRAAKRAAKRAGKLA